MTSEMTTNIEQRLILAQREAAKMATFPADAERALGIILRAMSRADKQLDDPTRNALREAAKEVRALAARIGVQNEHMATLYDLASGAIEQREIAQAALEGLHTAIKRRDVNHPIIRVLYSGMYDDIAMEHNANFWESLPYDLALGLPGWNFMQAQSLYDAVTFDGEEAQPEDYGWTEDSLNTFRTKLRDLVDELRNQEKFSHE